MDIDTNGLALGDTAKDEITGYEGIVIGVHQWYSGCAQISLQGPRGKDGKVPDTWGCDVTRLVLVTAGPRHIADRTKGGPFIKPPTNH